MRNFYAAHLGAHAFESGEIPVSMQGFFRITESPAAHALLGDRFVIDEAELRFIGFSAALFGHIDPPSATDIFPSASLRLLVENFDDMTASRIPLIALKLSDSGSKKVGPEALRAFFAEMGEINDYSVPSSAEFSLYRAPGGVFTVGGKTVPELEFMYDALKNR